MKTISIKNLVPSNATHPGEHLLDEIEARGIRQKDLAMEMDIPKSTLNEIIKGKKNITIDIALKLENVLDIPAKFWLNAQINYEIDCHRILEKNKEHAKISEIWKVIKSYLNLNFFKKQRIITGDIKENVSIIFKIFDVDSLDGFIGKFTQFEYQRYRKSEKSNVEINNLIAWINLVKYKAKNEFVSEFNNNDKDKVFQSIKEIINKNDEKILCDLKDTLKCFGIKFLTIPNPQKCAVDGVSFWSDGNPAIALSLRYKTIDSFAFTLFHELSHIYLHLINNNEKEYINLEEKSLQEEREADDLASQMLISENDWENIKSELKNNFYNPFKVNKISKLYKIHPAILQGRFCKETNKFNIKKIDSKMKV